jgi:hypothetical protein
MFFFISSRPLQSEASFGYLVFCCGTKTHISSVSPILLPEGKSAADATLSINYIVPHGSDIPVLLEPVSFIGHLFDSSSCFFLLWGHYNLFHA